MVTKVALRMIDGALVTDVSEANNIVTYTLSDGTTKTTGQTVASSLLALQQKIDGLSGTTTSSSNNLQQQITNLANKEAQDVANLNNSINYVNGRVDSLVNSYNSLAGQILTPIGGMGAAGTYGSGNISNAGGYEVYQTGNHIQVRPITNLSNCNCDCTCIF